MDRFDHRWLHKPSIEQLNANWGSLVSTNRVKRYSFIDQFPVLKPEKEETRAFIPTKPPPPKKRKIREDTIRARAEANGVNKHTAYKRLQEGWDIDKAVSTPPLHTMEGYVGIARKNNISANTYYRRVKRGWNKEDACTVPTNRSKKQVP